MRIALIAAAMAAPLSLHAQGAEPDELVEQIAEATFLASMCADVAVDEEVAFTMIDATDLTREDARKRIGHEFTALLSETDEDMEAASCETAAALYGSGGSDWPGLLVAAQ